jgi:hypothetical protein
MARDSRVVEFTIGLDSDRWAEVEAEVWPDVPERRSGHPDTWEPAEPGDVVVHSVVLWHDEHDEQRLLQGRELDAWSRGREVAIEDAARDAYERAGGDEW